MEICQTDYRLKKGYRNCRVKHPGSVDYFFQKKPVKIIRTV